MPLGSTPDMLVVLDEHPNSYAGLSIATRYARGIVALTSWDAATDHIDAEIRSSVTANPTIAEALRVAVQRRAPWIALRRDFAEPQALLSQLLVAAAQHTDDDIPGFAVILADGDPRPFRRILAIGDRSAGPISGLLAYIAVAVADRAGADIDILMLGRDDDTGPIDSLSQLAVNREQELLDRARARAAASGIEATWISLTTDADPWAVITDQIGQHDYDLIIDDLGDVALSRLGGLHRAAGAVVAEGQVGEIPLRLLREVPIPLLLVIDEIRLGIAPPSLLKLGTAAAVALGVVSTAALSTGTGTSVAVTVEDSAPEDLAAALEAALGVSGSGDDGASARAVERAVAAGTASRGGDRAAGVAATSDEAAPEAESAEGDPAAQGGAAADEPKPPKGGADPTDVAKAQKKASKEKAALQKDKAQKDRARKTLSEAEEALGAAQEEAESALAELSAATLSYAEAGRHLETVAADASGLTGVLPGGASESDLETARLMEQAAQERLTRAMDAGTEALDTLADAESEVEQAESKVERRAAEVAQTRAEYALAKETVAVYRESLAKSRTSPVAGGYKLTARFGHTGGYWSSGVHTGLDFAAPAGKDVRAAASGRVVSAGWEGAYGNKIVIDHGNGYQTAYSHLSDIDVSVGQKVQTGDHIGDIGSTGNSTGSHLHFEVLKNDKFIDPEAWLGW